MIQRLLWTDSIPLFLCCSDEEQGTISQGLDLLKTVRPTNCFYESGSDNGPSIIMTDDSCAEQNALHEAQL